MKLFKVITLLLVASIANPLCCCFGLDALVEAMVDEPLAPAHACCSMMASEKASEDSSAEGHEGCPHELERDSKIVDGDTGSHVSKPLSLANVLLERETLAFVAAKTECSVLHVLEFLVLPETGRSIGQAHCLYLL